MNDMTTPRVRPVRPARPKPLPLYLSPTWRTDALPVNGGALLAQAREGRLRALAACKGARRLAALVAVKVVWASPSFRARIEAIEASRSVVTA